MNFIIFRKPVHRTSDSQDLKLQKMTCCSLELDCKAADILNGKEEMTSGLDLIWQEEEERCRRSDVPFTAKTSNSQDRGERQVFKREADFLSILSKITGDTPLSSPNLEESDELLEEFRRIALEIQRQNEQQDFCPNDVVEEEDESDMEEEMVANRSNNDVLETLEMSQRLSDILSSGSQQRNRLQHHSDADDSESSDSTIIDPPERPEIDNENIVRGQPNEAEEEEDCFIEDDVDADLTQSEIGRDCDCQVITGLQYNCFIIAACCCSSSPYSRC